MLHDRDYMHAGPDSSSQGSFLDKAKGWSAIKTLVVVNVIFFILQIVLVKRLYIPIETFKELMGTGSYAPLAQREWRNGTWQILVDYSFFQDQLILSSTMIKQGQLWRIVTHMFAHANFMHIFFNMFVLWNFGKPVEQILGKKRFFYLYFFAGLIASAAFLAFNWLSGIFALGASGAVMGVFLASALFMPYMKIFFFLIPIPIPIWKFVKWYALISAVMLISRLTGWDFGPPWAHSAHLGGMLGGWIFVRFFAKTKLPSIDIFNWLSKFRAQKKRGGFTHVKAGGEVDADSADVDRILDKISHSGLSSLTDREKTVLDEARRKLRK